MAFFVKNCKKAIDTTRVELKHYLGIVNILSQLASAVISLLSLSTVNLATGRNPLSLFKSKEREHIDALEKIIEEKENSLRKK